MESNTNGLPIYHFEKDLTLYLKTNNLDVEIFAFSKSINYPTARKVLLTLNKHISKRNCLKITNCKKTCIKTDSKK